ncbi:MAG: hypothetical protein WAN39_00295 [Candidatus Cybelea sp.]
MPNRPLSARPTLGSFFFSAALALAAGCSGLQQASPTSAGPGALPPMTLKIGHSLPDAKRGKQVLYVANWYGSSVEVLSAKTHALVRQISTSPYNPNSVRVDGSGNLWVALDTNGSQPSIWVYKPGASQPFRTLNGISQAVGIAIDPNGTVYVTEEATSNVSVFAPGSDTPTSTLADPNATCCGWVAVDDQHDVYFTYESPSVHTGAIDEFVNGSGQPKSLGITLGTFPGGIEVLKNDTLVVTEQGIVSLYLPAKIDTFPKGATTPSSVITGNPNCDEWVGPALNKKKNRIYVGSIFTSTSCFINGTPAAMKEYTYPGGKLIGEYTAGITDQSGWTLLVPAISPAPADQ